MRKSRLLTWLVGPPLAFVAWRAVMRLIRHWHQFPTPDFLVDFLDTPLRRRFIQPLDRMPERLGLKPGMRVLEVGPGNGTYTLAVARHLGADGRVTAIDIQPRIVERLRARAAAEGAANVEVQVADVANLPFEDGAFDAVYMLSVVGELPEPERAIAEFARVLKPGGVLAFAELWPDPDYPWPIELVRLVTPGGFRYQQHGRGFLNYWMTFTREAGAR